MASFVASDTSILMLTCNTAFLSLLFVKCRNGMTMRVRTGGTVALGVATLARRSAECDAFPGSEWHPEAELFPTPREVRFSVGTTGQAEEAATP
jgi:hypothetical protein